MAPHSSTLAWKIPCKEEPGRLQFMESLRVGHNLVTKVEQEVRENRSLDEVGPEGYTHSPP